MLDFAGVLNPLLFFFKTFFKTISRPALIYNFYRSPSTFHIKTSHYDDFMEVLLWNTNFWLVMLKLFILHNVKIQKLLWPFFPFRLVSWKSITWVTSSNRQATNSNPQVTNSNLRVTSSSPRLTILNLRVTRSNLRATCSNPRFRRLKARVARLKA